MASPSSHWTECVTGRTFWAAEKTFSPWTYKLYGLLQILLHQEQECQAFELRAVAAPNALIRRYSHQFIFLNGEKEEPVYDVFPSDRFRQGKDPIERLGLVIPEGNGEDLRLVFRL